MIRHYSNEMISEYEDPIVSISFAATTRPNRLMNLEIVSQVPQVLYMSLQLHSCNKRFEMAGEP